MSRSIIFTKTPLEVMQDALKGLWADGDSKEAKQVRNDAMRSILENSHLLDFAHSRMKTLGNYATQAEINLLSRAIDVSTRFTMETITKPDRPLFFYELFLKYGLIKPTAITDGIRALKEKVQAYGDIQFISDATDDLPTQAEGTDSVKGLRVHPIGNSVRVGLIELRDAAREGRNLTSERISNQINSYFVFLDAMIANGAPNKAIFGLLNNPDLSANTFTVPPSVVNPPFSEWAEKSQSEVIADLALIKQTGFAQSNMIRYPNEFIVAQRAFDVLTLTQMPNQSGQFLIDAWAASQARNPSSAPMNISPALAFDGAASDGVSNMGIAGDFGPDALEMYFAPPEVLPTQNHGLHFHTPIISALSGVNIRRPEYLSKWEGM